VTELGIYGRAAYEWHRALAPVTLDQTNDPVTMFRSIDQTVSDMVLRTVQAWLRANNDPGTVVASLPQAFAENEPDQILAATRAAEIGPCLELVYQPTQPAPGDLIDGVKPSRLQVELLTTITWETRPSLEDLRLAARDLGEALIEGDSPEMLTGNDHPPLTTPTSLFPTELRVANQHLSTILGRPVDLYLLFS
jgi:hypothetical protein